MSKPITPAPTASEVEKMCDESRAPSWLKDAMKEVTAQMDVVPPPENHGGHIPELIYRH